MDITEIRRENLKRWVAEHGTPSKERSLFSQLKANGSFGERVARRLEADYRMGEGFLDRDTGVPAAESVPPTGTKRIREAGEHDASLTRIMKVRLKVQAGITGFRVEPEHHDGETMAVPTEWVRREKYIASDLLAIVVKGDSMETSLHDGDIIVVNTADKTLVDGVVYAINYEGEVVVKRMQRDAGMWWLTSDNADQRKYHRKACKGAECIVIGRVVKKESTHI